ncbi:MAG: hypothetical protein R6U36_10840 [Candidatus Fermentibacteraceae bacterium]
MAHTGPQLARQAVPVARPSARPSPRLSSIGFPSSKGAGKLPAPSNTLAVG